MGFYPATSFPELADSKTSQDSNMSKLDEDMSFKLIYGKEDSITAPLKIADIISTIPGILIREFLPDTRLD